MKWDNNCGYLDICKLKYYNEGLLMYFLRCGKLPLIFPELTFNGVLNLW